ncbi:uncharacterized protein IL334_005228 [Kwoniella shivajii]|uniref:Uncharacterized protein n=1 Tax=Kwoniella shivajii TaxID=564305 RepID=A0ABZ1D3S5_9TREE|nr:hypothetical protein IL334_005228 [Kwoniella shivajii]
MIIPLQPRLRLGRNKRQIVKDPVNGVHTPTPTPTSTPTPTITSSTQKTESDLAVTENRGSRTKSNTEVKSKLLVASTTSSSLMGAKTGISQTGSSSSGDANGNTNGIDNTNGGQSFSAKSTIYLNTFPADFPIQTPLPPSSHNPNNNYLFLKDQQVLDSMLIFATIFGSFLLLTILCIKGNSTYTRRNEYDNGKVDNVIMDDMKWAEGREVIERKIIWETAGTKKLRSGAGRLRR